MAFFQLGKDRKVRSSRLPQVIFDWNKSDPITDLDPPGTAAYNDVHGTSTAPCRFLIGVQGDIECLPKSLETDRSGIHLKFQIQGGKLAKSFIISAKVAGANIKKLHQAKLEFFLGENGQVTSLAHEKQTLVGERWQSEVVHVVSWDTTGAYMSGLEIVKSFEGETLEALSYMESFAKGILRGTSKVTIMVKSSNGLEHELVALKALQGPYPTPWKPYLNAKGQPQCGWRNLPTRKTVKAYSGGLAAVPPRNAFSTPTEALVMLANGTCLDYRVGPHTGLRSAWPRTTKEQTYLKCQLTALNRLLGNQSGKESMRWLPALLNHGVHQLATYDPLGSSELADADVEKSWTAAYEFFTWDENQTAALRSCRALKGRVAMIEGGPGSGKTMILAGIAIAYASCQFPVMLFGPTPAQARALGEAVRYLLQRNCKDLGQFYRTGAVLRLYQGENDWDGFKNMLEADDSQSVAKMFSLSMILISTPNAVCCPELASFGCNQQKIMVMHDDAHQVGESELWATVTGLDQRKKVEGLIMTADVKEWPLNIATFAPVEMRCKKKGHKHYKYLEIYGRYLQHLEKGNDLPLTFEGAGPCTFVPRGGLNEFAEQIGVPFTARLSRQSFPSTRLEGQHRIKNTLTIIPNRLVYHGLLKGRPSETWPDDLMAFHDVVRSWLGSEARGKDMSMIFLQASDGAARCIKEYGTTESKRNHRYVDVVYDLLIQNHKAGAMDAKDIKVVTPYRDQVRLYEQEFLSRAEKSGVPCEQLPKPLTVDSLRGHEARVIIYDLTVSCGDDSHGLGIVSNELRANMMATRAKDTLIIVGSEELIYKFPGFWQFINRQRACPNEPLPYIVQYATMLLSLGFSFKPATPDREPCTFKVLPEWKRREEGFHPWEWPVHSTGGFDKN